MTRPPDREPAPPPRRPPGRARTVVLGRHVLLVHCLEVVLVREGYEVRSLPTPCPDDPLPAVSTVQEARPRLALLVVDLAADRDDAARLVSGLAAAGTQVVVLTGSRHRARWADCLRHGASRVVSTHESVDVVLDALASLSRDLPDVDDAGPDRLGLLTSRERTVLALLGEGLTLREISAREVVAEGTVRAQVESILATLQVSSQPAAVALADRAAGRTRCPDQ
jgi:two-component system, NarL family, nitrate/nitrite response regulator NarL